MAKITVRPISKPSGIEETANATEVIIISIRFLPLNTPNIKTKVVRTITKITNCLLKTFDCFVKGVSSPSSCTEIAIFPTSVSSPVFSTKNLA